jgi:hypothetical protein
LLSKSSVSSSTRCGMTQSCNLNPTLRLFLISLDACAS